MIVQVIYTSKYDPRRSHNTFYNNVDISGCECLLYEDFTDGSSEWITYKLKEFSENLSTIKDVRCVSYMYSVQRHESTTLFEFEVDEVDEVDDESIEEIKQALDYVKSYCSHEQLLGVYLPGSSEIDDYTVSAIDTYYEIVNIFPMIE